MASQTHSYVRFARRSRPAPVGVSPESPPRAGAGPDERAWPTNVEMWNWAQSAVLFGYGPTASNFPQSQPS